MGRARIGWRPGERDQQEGVTVREFGTGPRIQISFYFRGIRCRECLKIELTPGNWKYAGRLRAEILNAIERQTFSYADYFPDSARARVFGHGKAKTTMNTLFDEFLTRGEKLVERKKMSPSTLSGYRKIIRGQLSPELGAIRVVDLTPAQLRDMVLKAEATAKTLRNRLSVLRLVLDDAVDAAIIDSNPMGRINLAKLVDKVATESTFEIDPFSAAERSAFLKACRTDEERDLFTFWFETGLRPGELIALAWPKVDWLNQSVRIDANIVERVEKAPKTKAGVRDVELTSIALSALERQKARTFLAGGKVWRSHITEEAWVSSELLSKTSYVHAVRKGGIRWRSMYQIRHTYASTHASAGRNLFWLANQMGHETIEILIRHYARWIPDLSPANNENGHVTGTQTGGAEIIRFRPRR